MEKEVKKPTEQEIKRLKSEKQKKIESNEIVRK